jgi:hypothetical protein
MFRNAGVLPQSMSETEIAKQLGVNVSAVYRDCQSHYIKIRSGSNFRASHIVGMRAKIIKKDINET